MSHKKKEEQTTKRIIASALHSFAQRGLPNVTLEEIALKIGMSNEVMFSYFESKEALIETILQGHLGSMKELLQSKRFKLTLYQLLSTLGEKTLLDEEESSFLPIYSEAFLPYIKSKNLKHEYLNFFNALQNFYVEELETYINIGEFNEEIDTIMLSNMLVSMLDGAVLHKGYFKQNEMNHKLLFKQKVALFYYELLHWHLQMRNYQLKYYAMQTFKEIQNVMHAGYQKVKYTIILYAKKKHQTKLRHG